MYMLVFGEDVRRVEGREANTSKGEGGEEADENQVSKKDSRQAQKVKKHGQSYNNMYGLCRPKY